MLQSMSNDMGISKYQSETNAHYTSRVLYSALASWVKASCLDHPLTTSEEGISRKHVSSRVNRVFDEYLKRFPESESWFYVDPTSESAISLIRSRLMRHAEIVNIGFDTNIALAEQHTRMLTSKLECVWGTVLQPGLFYSGVSTLRISSNTTGDIPEPTPQPVEEWLKAYVRDAWWHKYDRLGDETEYFDPERKTRNNQCWQSIVPHSNNGLVIARAPSVNTSREYMLVDLNKRSLHRIDPYLKEIGEHRRLLMGFRAACGNRVPVTLTRYKDHVHLALRVYLPLRETVLLESYAWPSNSIADRLEWDMSPDVWDYIKPQLISLGLDITEEVYG